MSGKRFNGKVVIVTGSSSGIGQAVLIGFAKEGASVVLHGTNKQRIDDTEQLLKDAGISSSKYLVFQGEIQKYEVQKKLIDETIKKFGRIDVLINNAGVVQKPGTPETSADNYDFVMDINLRAPYLLTQLALPHLEKTKGNVINTSSVVAYVKPFDAPAVPIYGASKAALDIWAKYDSQRLAELGIRINNVNPGPFETNIMAKTMPETLSKDEKRNIMKTVGSGLAGTVSMKRLGELDEVVPSYLLLADNTLSGFTTGTTVTVDGGAAYFAPKLS